MASKSKASEKILQLQLELNKVVIELKKMTEEGKGSIAEYEKLKKKFEQLAGVVKGAEGSVKRSFGQTKDLEKYKDRLQQLITAFNKIKSANNEIDRQVKKQTEEQTRRRKKQLEQEQRLLRSSIREGNAQRTAALKQFEARQKEFRRRRAAREKQIEKEITNNAIKEQKRRDQAAQRRDFRGGFAGQLTPRAIGGALGSLTKYLGLYKLVTVAAQAFNEITIGSVKQAIDFEKQLANLGAVAGVTGKDLQKLGKNALDVSTSTKFTATEVIGLQTELSKLGFTAQDVIAATEGIAFTAQALGSPLNATAEQIGKVVNQFNLLIEQSQFIGDVLVTSINNSALSFDSFGTAIQYVGPIARNLGLTFEQTAGAMAVLADNGFTASRIGTGLRGIFTELGKTSADVEASLKSLAEQNISLSEAVDLVGKRNAAQLITLLDNIDAIDEANDKYYQQGRALVAAAQQSDTFAGQMEILTSSFREFQIEIGTAIAESDLLLGILDALFTKGARTARGFKAINEIGFESFNEGAEKVSKGADELTTALELLGVTQEKYNEIAENAKAPAFLDTFFSLNPFKEARLADEAVAAQNEIQGLVDKLKEYAEETQSLQAIQSGQAIANDEYKETIDRLTQAYINQVDVTEDVDKTAEDIKSQLKDVNRVVETGIILQYDWATARTVGVELTDKEILKYKGLQGQLNSYLETLTNIIFKEDKLQASREQRLFREELSDYIERIKETEKVISELPEGVSDKIFLQQVDLLNGFFGEADDVIERAKERFGPDSEFVKALISTLKKAASKVSVELPEDPFADIILDTSDLEAFNPENIDPFGVTTDRKSLFADVVLDYSDLASFDEDDIEGVERIPAGLMDRLREAFKDFDWGSLVVDSIETATDAIGEFNDVALENTINRLRAEEDAIKNRYKTEQDILRSQLDNQLITEGQFRSKQTELRKNQIREENEIDKQIFESEKKRDRQNANTDYLEAIASIIPTLIAYDKTADPISVLTKAAITGGLATAAYAAEISAIGQRQFYPKKFSEGGVVNGPSHSSGGVPFTVQGQGGYEMEGGEFIVNKKATAMHKDLLERINGSEKTNPRIGKTYFQTGGLVSAVNNESVNYLKAIAEATTSTAISASKPVRAFVSSKDLRSNENERRLRDRNDRI